MSSISFNGANQYLPLSNSLNKKAKEESSQQELQKEVEVKSDFVL